MNYPDHGYDGRSCIKFIGGEDQATKRCREYIENGLKHYEDTRNAIMGDDYSSKLSPWLS
jgi:deoxyribodipyrimidine photo-lyase